MAIRPQQLPDASTYSRYSPSSRPGPPEPSLAAPIHRSSFRRGSRSRVVLPSIRDLIRLVEHEPIDQEEHDLLAQRPFGDVVFNGPLGKIDTSVRALDNDRSRTCPTYPSKHSGGVGDALLGSNARGPVDSSPSDQPPPFFGKNNSLCKPRQSLSAAAEEPLHLRSLRPNKIDYWGTQLHSIAEAGILNSSTSPTTSSISMQEDCKERASLRFADVDPTKVAYIGMLDIPGEGSFHVYEGGLRIPTHIRGQPVNPQWGITKAKAPRKRVPRACLSCRKKKVRCQPSLDGCLQCQLCRRQCST